MSEYTYELYDWVCLNYGAIKKTGVTEPMARALYERIKDLNPSEAGE